ncbi:hypothetical protein [Riemerella columbipharyngis]|uniref:Uncharacterized protein n=1 Tax=Riemerella columbipharyngis TaxID=1071918 RepID=A0A1G6ZDP8_9FLAO|nr:hypothetical protein [Riemerella columbipharyngis]SDE00317.1 hypothetical protein SAMN05421544_10239 [Riemerella columbipharyngis]
MKRRNKFVRANTLENAFKVRLIQIYKKYIPIIEKEEDSFEIERQFSKEYKEIERIFDFPSLPFVLIDRAFTSVNSDTRISIEKPKIFLEFLENEASIWEALYKFNKYARVNF